MISSMSFIPLEANKIKGVFKGLQKNFNLPINELSSWAYLGYLLFRVAGLAAGRNKF